MSATFKNEFGPAILRSRAVVAELGHSTIDAEHVLIGLLSSEDNGAARLLRSMNCPVDRVKQTVRASLPSANHLLLSLLRNAEDPLVDLLHREFALAHEGILDFLSGSPEGAE